MANRNMLPKHWLADYEAWLKTQGCHTRPGRGNYQVLQVRLPFSPVWHAIFFKETGNPHYTVPDPLYDITSKYLQQRHGNHHPAPGQQAARTEGPQRTQEAGGDPAPEDDPGPPF